MINEANNRPIRRIIYVDASFNNETKESKICLYDVDIDKINTLSTNIPTSSSFAERYAIMYACLYAKKFNLLDKKVHILNDNYSATIHTKIKELCFNLNISLSWIPREINKIADQGTQYNCNISIEDANIYDLFYELIIDNNKIDKEPLKTPKQIKVENETKNITNEKKILINAFQASKIENKPYIALGEIGKFLKKNNPSFTYSSLKKILEKYPKNFTIVNKNYVKLKD
jgi:hypothetical protein